MRFWFATMCLAVAAYAGPPLTTIQDVLYKADGTRFNGVLTINWNSFQAADNSAIMMQSATVKVVDGNLRVQLVPSTTATPAATYSVTYNSDGRVQFQERWAVPLSSTPLRVRDVRVANSGSSGGSDGGSGGAGNVTTVQESDVVGLVADLGARPVKAPTFAAGRVAMVNSAGLLESVSGSPSDCVRVDGSSGPCMIDPPSFIDAEAPSGIVDGANASFTLTAVPDPIGSLSVYRNGLLQKALSDYTVNGRQIAFVSDAIPQPGDTLLASYRFAGSGGSSSPYSAPQILCSGTGAATNAASLLSVGACTIAGGVLQTGDRVEVRYDLEHSGTAGGFTLEVRWGSTVGTHRDASASDVLVAGRVNAALVSGGARLSGESWGSVLPFAASVASSSDSYTDGLTLVFLAKTSSSSDTVTLRNYTVLRLP